MKSLPCPQYALRFLWSVASAFSHFIAHFVGDSAGTEESRSSQSPKVLQGNTADWLATR